MVKYIFLALALAGCSTTGGTFSEPARSYYYVSCLQADLMATTCQCMEAAAVKATGITNIEKASNAEKELLLEAVHAAKDSCDAATMKAIEEAHK